MMERSTSSIATDTAAAWRVDRAAIDAALERIVARDGGALAPHVRDTVQYALLGGGKRLRGLLLLAAYRAAGGTADAAPLAASVEIIHAYSLVHDDLPCMDDDAMRRGRPTAHRVYGVGMATVAGITMVPLAARAAFDAALELARDEHTAGRIAATLLRAAGAGGMIGGQLLDLEGEGQPLSIADLEQIHRAKTGALIGAAVVTGGMAAGADARAVGALERFGASIGLAFQIADDLLDITGSTATLGKHAGRDVDLGKSTYPALLGIESATRRADELIREGETALRETGVLSTELERLARFVVERQS